MLEIMSTASLISAMKAAESTNTQDSLIGNLLWLDKAFGHKEVVVRLYADLPASERSLCWSAHKIIDGKREDACFYNGGLVLHDTEWSIHS